MLDEQYAESAAITEEFILEISCSRDAYERGERHYREGKILSYSEAGDAGGGLRVKASIEGNYKNYDVSLKISHSGGLEGHGCSCESSGIWSGACKHVVAALFAHAEGYARAFSAEKMTRRARALVDGLEKIIFDGMDDEFGIPAHIESGHRLRIVPTLHWSDSKGLFLTLEVGGKRLYVVKSISGFVGSFRAGETVTYGQGLTITHRREMFDEASQQLVDFLANEDDTYDEISRRLAKQFQFTHHPLAGNREMHLTPRNIDCFFRIFEGFELDVVSDICASTKLRCGCPPVSFGVRHLAGGALLFSDKFMYRVMRGCAHCYFLTATGLYRTPKADGLLLIELLKAMDDSPGREIMFAGEDERRFLTVVLPKMLKMGLARTEGPAPSVSVSPLTGVYRFGIDKKDVLATLSYRYGDAVLGAQSGGREGVVRDLVGEYSLRRRLLSAGFAEDGGEFRLKGNDLIYAFLHGDGAASITSIANVAEVFVCDELDRKTRKAPKPKIGLSLAGNLLKVSLEDSDYDIAEFLDALEAYRLKKKYFRLRDGRFISLDDETVAAAAGMLESLEVTRKDISGGAVALPAYRAFCADEIAKSWPQGPARQLKKDAGLESMLSALSATAGAEGGFAPPRSLSGVLREYQKAGYFWLKSLSRYGFGGILADDMGLGKTLQVISVLLSEKNREKRQAPPAIVVAPTSLLYNWENEINKFAPELRVAVVTGQPESRREMLMSALGADVYITTYDMLKRDREHYAGLEFSYIIADEAQNIKNPGTVAAKSVKELNGRVRFALTGTPIENNLSELWSIFDFIMPGYLYSAGKFSRVYEAPIVKFSDQSAAARLRKQIAPFVLRRLKKNVLTELPDKTETVLQADLAPEQKALYRANLMIAKGALDECVARGRFADSRMQILAQLTRLRQICCHPALFLEGYGGASGKLSLTLETIQLSIDNGHRVLLFSQFTAMLLLIRGALEDAGIRRPDGSAVEHFYMDGATKAKERTGMAERFNAGERDLFLISLKAGGTGLNLTGADVVIHYDPWWNPSVMDQASDRAHRFGQKKAVQVFNIVAKDSIEEKIMALQEKKRGLIDSVITEGTSFINLLGEEEVRELFSYETD